MIQVTYSLENVNAALESLAPVDGFRKFIMQRPLGLQMSGTVRRSQRKSVELVVEGYLSEINAIEDTLMALIDQGMIQNFVSSEKQIRRREKPGFRILPDMTYSRSARRPDGIET